MEPGGQIVGRHPQGAALLLGVKRQGVALQRLHMEDGGTPPLLSRAVRGGLGARELPPLPLQAAVLIVDLVVDVAGGQAVDVRLNLLAAAGEPVAIFVLRALVVVAVTDGGTGAGSISFWPLPATAVT